VAKNAAAREIGPLSERELLLVGVALYWAEGSKDKPYSRRERVTFINSDPDVITLYLRWLDLLGVEPSRRRFHLSIHESADVGAALVFWAELIGVPPVDFCKTTLKRHNPRTVRHKVGEDYRGCLAVRVNGSADLYRRIEGWWSGIVGGAELGSVLTP
jgi:hypothetical protein